MLKRTLPGLSEEETEEFRNLDVHMNPVVLWGRKLTQEEIHRWSELGKQIVWARVGNE